MVASNLEYMQHLLDAVSQECHASTDLFDQFSFVWQGLLSHGPLAV